MYILLPEGACARHHARRGVVVLHTLGSLRLRRVIGQVTVGAPRAVLHSVTFSVIQLRRCSASCGWRPVPARRSAKACAGATRRTLSRNRVRSKTAADRGVATRTLAP